MLGVNVTVSPPAAIAYGETINPLLVTPAAANVMGNTVGPTVDISGDVGIGTAIIEDTFKVG